MFFKDGDTVFKFHYCTTASWDSLFCGHEAIKTAANLQQAKRSAVQGGSFAFLACLHSRAATVEAMAHLKFEHLPHPLYSPSDYHMFGQLKEALHGWRFASDNELKDTVHMWLQSQLKTFFTVGIRRLVNHYTKCTGKSSDYVEKWYSCISHRLLHTKLLLNSLYILTLFHILCISIKNTHTYLSIILNDSHRSYCNFYMPPMLYT